jgi:hypothetical protein
MGWPTSGQVGTTPACPFHGDGHDVAVRSRRTQKREATKPAAPNVLQLKLHAIAAFNSFGLEGACHLIAYQR